MIIRSRAPLRLGLAGGASDVSPFCDLYGGYVLNAAIDMYAYCHLEPLAGDEVEFVAADQGARFAGKAEAAFALEEPLLLHKAIYNRAVRQFNGGKPLPVRLTTHSDAPPGSGLGSSSTLVVAILQAFVEWMKLPLGEYDVAHLAYEIERVDAAMLGGRQDQYAATFGGFNFIEFYAGERVIVNPLRIRQSIRLELESSMLLYYTGLSRISADVISEQKRRVLQEDKQAIQATKELKNDALLMKESLLKRDIREVARVLGRSWEAKKKIAQSITNPQIDQAYESAIRAGAWSGRISGAGGGGFIIFMTDPVCKLEIARALAAGGGRLFNFHFSESGACSWTV